MDFTVLIEAGVDVSGAIERFVGNEQLFARMLKKFIDEPSYGKLCAAIEAKDEKEALEASHTLNAA